MNNPSQDGWDWPYILYVGRKWLGYTDDQIWSLTPRQFYAQLEVHKDVTSKMYGSSSNPVSAVSTAGAGFIDQIPGW
jgi:hypothetical protein